MLEAEAALAQLSMFERLRPDELGEVARLFEVQTLPPGTAIAHEGGSTARMFVAVRGELRVAVRSPEGELVSVLEPGDRHGDLGLLTGHGSAASARAGDEGAVVALLDRAGLDAVLARWPAVALPLAEELASELRTRQDVARQLLELHAEHLPAEELSLAVAERRRALGRRGARVVRTAPRSLFRRMVVQQGAEPPFWMLAGFAVSLGLARLMVFFILHFHLEHQLFALVKSPGDPNPMHVHHFNYGLVLIAASGLAALFPFGRRALRVLAAAFGVGCGLVFDEFALFWNLDPDYAQSASVVAAGAALVVLVQLVWFRAFWGALGRRFWRSALGVR